MRQLLLTGLVLGLLTSLSSSAATLRYRVEGVDDALRSNIRAYLGLSPETQADAERFLLVASQRTTRALEAMGYYRAAVRIEEDRSVTPRRVTVIVDPGDPLLYTDVQASIAGPGEDDASLLAVLKQHVPAVGDVLHHGRYELLKEELQQQARRQGYFDGEFQTAQIVVDVTADTAAMNLVFATGSRYTFGELRVGSTEQDLSLVRQLSPIVEGEPYRDDRLLVLRQRLLRPGYFRGVTVQPLVSERQDGQVPVRVELTPASAHSFEVGVGYSTDTRQRLSLVWQSPRLNTWGHSQETSLRWSPVNPEARFTYSIPLDPASNDVLQGIARLEDNEYGDLDSHQRAFSLRRERTQGARVTSVHARILDEEWGVFTDSFSANFVLAGVTFSQRYRRGSLVDPELGFSQFYSIEGASIAAGSDEDVLRLYGSLAGVYRLGEKWRAVARGEVGHLWSSSRQPQDLPPSLAFFAGGDNSIRGYGYQSVGREVAPRLLDAQDEVAAKSLVVGGSRLLTGSLEVQRYFGERWRGALFVDAGDAFVDDFETNIGVGFGVHYLSPVGALRVELANPVTRDGGSWRLHINIGAEF